MRGADSNFVISGRLSSPSRSFELSPAVLSLESLLVVAALVTALIGQGGFYRRVALSIGLMLACAALLFLVHTRLSDLRHLRWLAAGLGLAAACTAITGAVNADLRGTLVVVAGIGGFGAIVFITAASGLGARRQLADLAILLGTLLALSGWVGVVFRIRPLARTDGGLWRAATTVTYENAAAAILAMLALWALARTTSSSSKVGRAAVVILTVGLGATMSRAGIVGFSAGVAALVVLLGPRIIVRSATAAMVGGLVAVAGLVPGVTASGTPRPELAFVALCAGLGIGIVDWPAVAGFRGHGARSEPGHSLYRRVGVVVLLLIGVAATSLVMADHAKQLSGRLGVSSPDRTSLSSVAVHMWLGHPIAGVGPGRALFEWTTQDHQLLFDRFAHDEYLQTAAEQGALGLLGIAGIYAGATATMVRGWRSTTRRRRSQDQVDASTAMVAGAIAGSLDLVVHSGFDFLWHVPAVLMIAAIGVGLAGPLVSTRRDVVPATEREGITI